MFAVFCLRDHTEEITRIGGKPGHGKDTIRCFADRVISLIGTVPLHVIPRRILHRVPGQGERTRGYGRRRKPPGDRGNADGNTGSRRIGAGALITVRRNAGHPEPVLAADAQVRDRTGCSFTLSVKQHGIHTHITVHTVQHGALHRLPLHRDLAGGSTRGRQ